MTLPRPLPPLPPASFAAEVRVEEAKGGKVKVEAVTEVEPEFEPKLESEGRRRGGGA